MKRRRLSIMLAMFSGLCACAPPAPPSLTGRYVEHIEARDNPPWRALVGDFEFDFDAHGRLSVRQLGGVQMVHARYRFDGDLLTIDEYGGESSCRDSGLDLASALYRVQFVADGLRLQVVRDECRGRREAMPLRAMRRITDRGPG
jgi:hypothetical protein